MPNPRDWSAVRHLSSGNHFGTHDFRRSLGLFPFLLDASHILGPVCSQFHISSTLGPLLAEGYYEHMLWLGMGWGHTIHFNVMSFCQ